MTTFILAAIFTILLAWCSKAMHADFKDLKDIIKRINDL